MRKFLLQLKVPFFHSSRSHSQDTVERFWFNPTAWHCDVMTSQHDAPKLIFPISACRCARKMILFLFLWNFGLLSSKMLSVLYLHDDVTSWRHVMTSKTGCTLSQLVEVLERWFFFCFYSILGCQVQKYHRFCIFICGHVTKWRYDVMAWLYDVTKLTPSISTCRVTRQMIRLLPVYIWLLLNEEMSLLNQEMS